MTAASAEGGNAVADQPQRSTSDIGSGHGPTIGNAVRLAACSARRVARSTTTATITATITMATSVTMFSASAIASV
jgi:hypothetical protein